MCIRPSHIEVCLCLRQDKIQYWVSINYDYLFFKICFIFSNVHFSMLILNITLYSAISTLYNTTVIYRNITLLQHICNVLFDRFPWVTCSAVPECFNCVTSSSHSHSFSFSWQCHTFSLSLSKSCSCMSSFSGVSENNCNCRKTISEVNSNECECINPHIKVAHFSDDPCVLHSSPSAEIEVN